MPGVVDVISFYEMGGCERSRLVISLRDKYKIRGGCCRQVLIRRHLGTGELAFYYCYVPEA